MASSRWATQNKVSGIFGVFKIFYRSFASVSWSPALCFYGIFVCEFMSLHLIVFCALFPGALFCLSLVSYYYLFLADASFLTRGKKGVDLGRWRGCGRS